MKTKLTILLTSMAMVVFSQIDNSLNLSLGNLFLLSNAETRSISPENFTGEKGKGGMATLEEGNAAGAASDLGQGWKVNPFIIINPGTTFRYQVEPHATFPELPGKEDLEIN